MELARVLTWNLERKRPTAPRGAEALDRLFALTPDVMVLTEARTSMDPRGGHLLWAEPPRGSRFAADERKVVLWSRQPWHHVDRVGVPGLDQTRFISATTETPIGPIRVLGICIPWHMAEVTYPVDQKHKPWELHIRYLQLLEPLLTSRNEPTVAAGDFNQQVPRVKYGNRAAAEALESAFAPLHVATRGQLEGCDRHGIDHIALGPGLQPERVWGWPNNVGGNRQSDHDGAGCDIARV